MISPIEMPEIFTEYLFCLHLCATFHYSMMHDHENINNNEMCNKARYTV